MYLGDMLPRGGGYRCDGGGAGLRDHLQLRLDPQPAGAARVLIDRAARELDLPGAPRELVSWADRVEPHRTARWLRAAWVAWRIFD